jgi:hypothetical protein
LKCFRFFKHFFFLIKFFCLNFYNLLQTTQPWPLSFAKPLAPLWHKSFIAILTFSPIDQTLVHDPPIKHTWHFVLFWKISNIDHFLCMGLDFSLNKALLLAFISSCNWLMCVQLFPCRAFLSQSCHQHHFFQLWVFHSIHPSFVGFS